MFVDYMTQPTRNNTGLMVNNRVQTMWMQSNTITTGGTQANPRIIENVTFTDRVVVQAPYITFRNCLFTGAMATFNTGLLDTTHVNCVGIRAEYCDFNHTNLTFHTNCVLGHDTIVYRCWLNRGVDGVGGYNTAGGNANIQLLCSYVNELAWWSMDNDHTDGTHNDGVQIQSGGNVTIRGNTFYGYKYNANLLGLPIIDSGANNRYPQVGNIVLIQKNAAAGNVTPTNINISDNWIYGGDHGIVLRTGTIAVVENNKWMDNGQRNYGGSLLYYYIRITSDVTLNGQTYAAQSAAYTQPAANNKVFAGTDATIRVDAA